MVETPKTAILKYFGELQYDSKLVKTANTLTPGAVVKLSGSELMNLEAGDAGLNLPVLVVMENEIIGEGITATYAAAEYARFARLRAGDEFYGKVAVLNDVSEGDLLVLEGTGGDLTATTSAGDSQIFQALEDVDNYPGTAAARIKVRVIDAIAYV